MNNIDQLKEVVQLADRYLQLGPLQKALFDSVLEGSKQIKPVQPVVIPVPDGKQFCRQGHDTFKCGRDNDKNKTCKICRKAYNQSYQDGLRKRRETLDANIAAGIAEVGRTGSMTTTQDIVIIQEISDLIKNKAKALKKAQRYLRARVNNSRAWDTNKAKALKSINSATSIAELKSGIEWAVNRYSAMVQF